MNFKHVEYVDGTGADITLELGYVPDAVEVINATDRTKLEYYAVDDVNAKGIATGATGTVTAAAAGIAIPAGVRGITIEGGATVNVSGKKLVVLTETYA